MASKVLCLYNFLEACLSLMHHNILSAMFLPDKMAAILGNAAAL